jgi:hypothetical protein
MKGLLCLLLITFSFASYANDDAISDWRLDKPYLYGFVQGATLGLFPAYHTIDELNAATPASVLSYSPLVAEHLVRHATVPFYLGMFSALSIYGYGIFLVLKRRQIQQHEKEQSCVT